MGQLSKPTQPSIPPGLVFTWTTGVEIIKTVV